MPLILAYNRTLPDIKIAVNKHWDISKINRDFEQVFTKLPIIAFRRNRNLHDILVEKTIINNRKQPSQNSQNGYSKPCNSNLKTIYAVHKCNQQSPSEVDSHTKPSKYTINLIAKANT